MLTLLKSIIPTILDWLWGKLKPLFGVIKENSELENRQDERMKQAKVVEELRKEILKLKKQNAVVSNELKEKLLAETNKLLNM